MTAQLVPTSSDAFYSETVALDGTAYILDFAYSQRSAAWLLTVSTIDGALVAAGLKLVCDWDLLIKCVSPSRPAGKLFVLSNTTDRTTPGLFDLVAGARGFLVYMPAADVAAIQAGP